MNKIKFLQENIPEEVFFFETGLKWATSYLDHRFNDYMQQSHYNYPADGLFILDIKDFIEAQRTIDKYRKILDTELYKAIHDK